MVHFHWRMQIIMDALDVGFLIHSIEPSENPSMKQIQHFTNGKSAFNVLDKAKQKLFRRISMTKQLIHAVSSLSHI